MIIWVVTNLISGDDQFKLRIHYCCESQLGLSLKICGSFPCIRFLPDSEMLPLKIISFSLLCLHPPHPNISSSLSHCPQSIQENSSIFLPEKIYASLLRQQGSFLQKTYSSHSYKFLYIKYYDIIDNDFFKPAAGLTAYSAHLGLA